MPTSGHSGVIQAGDGALIYYEVAGVLEISINTVRTHVRCVYAKLDVSTKVEAVRIALQRGIVA